MPKKALLNETHGQGMRPIAELASQILQRKRDRNLPAKLSRGEKADILARIAALDTSKQLGSVDFSRCVPSELLRQYKLDRCVEFETIGPYLADYVQDDNQIHVANLTPEDAIGLRLTRCFRQFFPAARLVSLIDDYNDQRTAGADTAAIKRFTPAQITEFRQSLISLLKGYGAISPSAVEGREYLLVSEAAKVADAEKLIATLDTMHVIRRRGQEIIFHNPQPENPLLGEFHLRTKNGKWLCHALDAAAFITQSNMYITHIIVLPSYMKAQQDKVWEILRVLGFDAMRYHNIFYNPGANPDDVVDIISDVFREQRDRPSN